MKQSVSMMNLAAGFGSNDELQRRLEERRDEVSAFLNSQVPGNSSTLPRSRAGNQSKFMVPYYACAK